MIALDRPLYSINHNVVLKKGGLPSAPTTYYTVSRLNEIATKISEDSQKVNKYLQTLVNLQIVQKVYPFGENPQNSRKGIYRILDNCYAFWYSFVFPNRPEIESGSGDIIAEDLFGDRLTTYIGKPPFETVCMQYLQRANRNKKLPFAATSFGSWWGTDPKEMAQTDFDVIAANRNKRQIILCECKWKKDVSTAAEAKKLMSKNHLLSEYEERHYYIYTKAIPEEKNNTERVTVITIDAMYN